MKGKDLGNLGPQQKSGGGPQREHLSKEEIKDLDSLACDECGNQTFTKGLVLKHVPSVHPSSPPGEEALQPVQAIACLNCGSQKDIHEDY